MTPEQDNQFNLFGCGARCVLKLAEIEGKLISKDEFLERFSPRYPFWSTQCGLTSTSMILDMSRDLGLCTEATAFRSKQKVRELFTKKLTRGVFVLTDAIKNQTGEIVELFHCRLLLCLNGDAWRLYQPNQDGADLIMQAPESELEEKLVHFLVLA